MYKILYKRELAMGIWEMRIEAPRVARAALPGQFVIVRADEHGERIPLTIADYDSEEGWVTIVTQAIGVSTRKVVALEEGESLIDFAGPLGRPSDFVKEPIEELRKRRFLFVAGGVGTAPVYPQVKWLSERGVECEVIIGAKTKDLVTAFNWLRAIDLKRSAPSTTSVIISLGDRVINRIIARLSRQRSAKRLRYAVRCNRHIKLANSLNGSDKLDIRSIALSPTRDRE